MATYALSQTIPCEDQYQVIVVGGGPAGCTAAAAAAREGARTLLIEASGCLGGAGTSGLVPAWTPYSDGERIVYGGMAQKVLEQSKAGSLHIRPDATDWVPIDPEKLKRIYDDLVAGHGATVLFNTVLAHVDARGGKVQAIVTASKWGLRAYRAPVFVDCTGDADLCAWAGAAFHKGNAQGEKLMPATHCFMMANVDEYAYRFGPQLFATNPDSPIHAILTDGKYRLIPDFHLCNNTVGPGTVGFNAGHLWDVDGTDPANVSAALMKGRKMAAAFRDALAEYCPGAFGNSFLVATAAQMGIRETRRIVGDYVLTLEDYIGRRSFADEICRNNYFIDVHWAKDEIANNPAQFQKWDAAALRYGKGESHGIPYRCLTPQGLQNALVAGRCVSTDQAVQGSVRVMPTCLAMGEAAGIAAAQAVRSDGDVHRVDVAAVRAQLRHFGAYLP